MTGGILGPGVADREAFRSSGRASTGATDSLRPLSMQRAVGDADGCVTGIGRRLGLVRHRAMLRYRSESGEMRWAAYIGETAQVPVIAVKAPPV